jgi:AraC-type transcriptional regulator N-terminus
MATNDLEKLASAVERQAISDGPHDTAVSELRLSRLSAPSDRLAIVYEPSLCIIAQGSKDVFLADETYRFDSAHSLLVSVDLPVTAQVVESSDSRVDC